MAITWEVKITPLDVSRKEASITAIRTDNTDPENILIEIHNIITAILDTQQQKIDILNDIWQQHLVYQARQMAIGVYISDLEEQAKISLEGREP